MKEHRSLEGLSLFSWAKAGKKCQASIIMGFYSGQVALATYKQTWLVEPPATNPKIRAWPPPVLKEVHWILHAGCAQQAANPTAPHTAGQAGQGSAAERQGAQAHTSLLQNTGSRGHVGLSNGGS